MLNDVEVEVEEEEEKNEEVVRMMGRSRRKGAMEQLCWAVLHRSVGQ